MKWKKKKQHGMAWHHTARDLILSDQSLIIAEERKEKERQGEGNNEVLTFP